MAKGKGKSKGGLTGVSRFVFETMASQAAPAPLPKAEAPLVPPAQQEGGHASKKRKMNDGASVVEQYESEGSAWIAKYDASGLVPHYSKAEEVPEHLKKYFSQRYRFFSEYSTPPGCLLDEEGWYSVTPELIADQIAERCRCDTILDAFCGVGGNAIAFAKTCQRVIALDTSPTRLALARHNAQIYGVADRIEFILMDFLAFAKSYISRSATDKLSPNKLDKRKIDVVFLSPPWGGPAYLSGEKNLTDNDEQSDALHPSYPLSAIQPIPGDELFALSRRITHNLAYYLPRNTKLEDISALICGGGSKEGSSTNEQVEVEEEWMGNKLKALTCYFGGLASGQEELF